MADANANANPLDPAADNAAPSNAVLPNRIPVNVPPANQAPANLILANTPPTLAPANAANNTALVTVVQALNNAIVAMQAPQASPTIYDPFAPDQPFNIATRAGA